MQTTCSVQDCGRNVRCRGLCIAHYGRYRREHAAPTPECSVDDCLDLVLAKGFCRRHYARWQKHGSPDILLRRSQQAELCTVYGCGRLPIARDLCTMHYARWKVHGDPLTKLVAEDGAGTVSLGGYRVFHTGGSTLREHRLVVEHAIGRPLTPDEHVHHINGDKLDNRLENLLVVTPAEHMRIHHRLPDNTETHKRCPTCARVLPREAFALNRARHDGLSPRCKECRRALKS